MENNKIKKINTYFLWFGIFPDKIRVLQVASHIVCLMALARRRNHCQCGLYERKNVSSFLFHLFGRNFMKFSYRSQCVHVPLSRFSEFVFFILIEQWDSCCKWILLSIFNATKFVGKKVLSTCTTTSSTTPNGCLIVISWPHWASFGQLPNIV